MGESYSVQAVLSAVDNMSGPMKSAAKAAEALGNTAKETSNKMDGVFQDNNGRWRAANGRFLTTKEKVDLLGESADKTGNKLGGMGDKALKTINTIGKGTMAVGTAVTAMGVSSLKAFGQFQSSLNKAAVTAGGTSKDISGLSDVANKMGADLPLSAQDAADAMVQMAQAGANVGQIKSQFPAIAEAATATGADLQATASTVQNAMNIWGDSLKSPSRAAAILTDTANLSNASIEDMSNALANVGGAASNMGMSMQDTSTAIGLLTNRGFSAAQASQDLNHAILQMQAPSKVAKTTMDKLGLSFTDAQGKMKSFPQILSDIGKSMDGMTSAEKAKALKSMFGTAGMGAMLPLLDSIKNKSGNTSKSWDAMSKKIQADSGTAGTAAKFLSGQASEMQKNIGSKVEQVGGNWESLRNKSMNSQNAMAGGMLDMINKTLQWASESKSGIAGVIRAFIGVSPVLGPIIIGIGGLLIVIAKVGNAAATLGRGFLAIGKGTIGLVEKLFGIAGGNTAVAATSGGAATGEEAVGKSAGKSAGEMLAMGLAILEIGAGIGLIFGGLALLVLSITQLAKQGMNGVIALAAFGVTVAVLAGVFALLGPALTAGSVGLIAFGVAILAAGVGIALFGAGVLAIGAGINLAGAGVLKLAQAFAILAQNVTMVVPVMTAIGVGFGALITGILNSVITNIPLIGQAFITLGQTVLNTVVTLTPQLIQTVMNVLITLVNAIVTYIPIFTAKIAQLIISILTTITTYLPQIILAGTNLIVNLLNGIALALPRIITAAVNVIVAFIEGIANNLGRIINAGLDLIAKFVMGIVNAIPRLASIAVQAVERFVYGVGNALGQILASGTKLIQIFIKGIMSGLNGSKSAGSSNGNAVKNGTSGISLFSNGEAIINSFLSGLRAAYAGVQSFVSGIAGWIKSHKGPISYDRKLLIPAGNAIMLGLNEGLIKQFKTVQSNVTSMAGQIANSVQDATPILDTKNISNGFNSIQSLSAATFGGNINGSMTLNTSSMDQQNNRLLQKLVNKNSTIVMDTGALVGATADPMNGSLGNYADVSERWRR